MNQYNNYLFDLYGTLADIHTDEEQDALWEELACYYASLGAEYTPKTLKTAFRTFESEETRMLLKNSGIAFPEPDLLKVFRRLYTEKGLSPSEEIVLSTAAFFRMRSRTYIKLYPETLPVLTTLKANGSRLYLLSNAQAAFTRPELRLLGLIPYFDDIFLSSEQGCKKPGSDFFLTPFRKHQLDPRKTLMTGNDLLDDISGAQAIGMDCAYIHTSLSRKNLPSELMVCPTYWLKDLTDLLRFRN